MRAGVWSQVQAWVHEDRYEGQEHEEDRRGQVNGDTKLQEAGCVSVGCCIASPGPGTR